jgi:hypothetical protein
VPPDAVEQVNAKIPIDKKTGKPKFPENDAFNGYTTTSTGSPSGPRRLRRASRTGTGWPCASG